MSTTTLRAPSPGIASAMPPAPNSTASTSGVSGTIVKTTSAARATSAALAQRRADVAAIASGTRLRVWTKSWWPASARCSAIGVPMMPRPMNPTFMVVPWDESEASTRPASGHRSRVEQDERVLQLPLLRPRLLPAAGDVEHQPEQLPADVLDRRFAVGDAAGVDVHQVVPAAREIGPRRDLDHRHLGEAVRRAAPGREDVQVHARGELQRAADEVARRRRRVDEAAIDAAVAQPLAGRKHPADRRAAALDDRAHRLLDDVRQAALLVARRRVGAAVGEAAL